MSVKCETEISIQAHTFLSFFCSSFICYMDCHGPKFALVRRDNSGQTVQMQRLSCHCLFNPLYTGELFHCYMLDKSICHFRGVGSILSL